MGIRFHCPNGHKLNVKSFLAGKRGFCPRCSVKLTVPLSSETGSEDESIALADADDDEAATTEALEGGIEAAAAGRLAAEPPPLPLGTPVVDAALAEAPEARWYMADSDGRRDGPYGAEQMRDRLAEGRVSPEMLVWREGWSDWQSAGTVFASRFGPPAPLIASTDWKSAETSQVIPTEGAAPYGASASLSAIELRLRRQRGRVMVLAGMLVAVAVLGVAVWAILAMQ